MGVGEQPHFGRTGPEGKPAIFSWGGSDLEILPRIFWLFPSSQVEYVD